MLVLLDNISKFRLFYLDKLLSVATNINSKYIAKLNVIIEETCGLIMEITHLILKDFINYFAILSNHRIEYPFTQLNERIVVNEYKELKVNIDVFIELSDILKSSNEMYVGISCQLNSLVLTSDDMTLVKHYLSRCRYNVSKLIFTSNSYFNNSTFDEEQYWKYRNETNKSDKNANREFNYDDSEWYNRKLKDTNERIGERLKPRSDNETEKAKQLSFLLNM